MYIGRAIINGQYFKRETQSWENINIWLGSLLVRHDTKLNCTDLYSGAFRGKREGESIGHYTIVEQ